MEKPMSGEQPLPQKPSGKLLIITGMSGAGKSQVIMTLEDMGYFCVDNLPPALFSKFIAGMRLANESLPKMAIVADVRAGVEMIPQIEQALSELNREGVDFQVIFMEASDNVLLARYKENRRPHPLSKTGRSTLDCVREERQLMEGLRGLADIVIDTTEYSNQGLARHLNELLADESTPGLTISVTSFGYKFGIPIDADLVMDVRFLPNPYYIPELKPFSGLEKPVADFVMKNDTTREFLRIYLRMLRYLLPHYQEEGKKHISIAIGCTGGRHRSVALAEYIGKKLRALGYTTTISHRDMERKRETI
jgi:RNase adapter protein RapZ